MGMCEVLMGEKPSVGTLVARGQLITEQQINSVCEISGSIEGVLVFGMPMITGDRIASHLTGVPVVTFDQSAASAIVEFSSRLSGSIAGILLQLGFPVTIGDARIIRGANVRVQSADLASVVVPLTLPSFGTVDVSVAIREGRASIAA